MKRCILKEYKGRIDSIMHKFPKEDINTIDDYLRFRRTKASDEKCRHYLVKLVILRDVIEQPFSKWNNNKLIEETLILIKNSDREISEKNELRKILKNFLKWKFKDLELSNIVSYEKQPAVNRAKINKNTFPTDQETEKIFKVCTNLKTKSMFTLQDELGLRPTELLNLKWNNIKFFDDHAEVTINSTKTGTTRILPCKTALTHLLRWRNEFQYYDRREDDYVYPSDDRTMPYYKSYLSMMYRRLCKKAKIRSISPYSFRHRRLHYIYQKTKDLKLASKYGGHSIEIAEKVYQHFDEDDIKDFIMEKVYDVKEPDIGTQKNLFKEIEDLKKSIGILQDYVKGLEQMIPWEKILVKDDKWVKK